MERIMQKWMMTFVILFFANLASAQSMGALQVNGVAGKFQIFQKVKAVRCNTQQRGACDDPVYLNLNKAEALATGSYLVGFENSLYPDLVVVESGKTTTLNLERIAVPSRVRGQKIRVYRDFSTLVEQRKIYLEMFYMNRHFFRLDANNFGDLYLSGAWERDFVQRFTYDTCARINTYGETSISAETVCKAWNKAKGPNDLREIFEFSSDGTFREMWVTYPGDVVPSKHPRYLVSTPMTEQDFVAVFPGAYKVQAEGKNMVAISVKSGNQSQNSTTYGFSLNPLKSFISLGGRDCSSAQTWKTEFRAYCTSDQQEGCDRAAAESCEPM